MSDATACVCGHSIEEHGHDPAYPGSTACTECDCIAFEREEDAVTSTTASETTGGGT